MNKFKIKKLNKKLYNKIKILDEEFKKFDEYISFTTEIVYIKSTLNKNIIFIFIITEEEIKKHYEYEFMFYNFETGKLLFIDNYYSSLSKGKLLKMFDSLSRKYQRQYSLTKY